METPRLNRRLLASYSGISMPIAALLMPVAVYLPPFYSEGLGMNLATVGFIFTLARMWDVVTDPVMGIIIDRFDTRWGRRKHWIALSVPILMVSIWMIFIPDKSQVSGFYLGFWLIVMYLGYTMLAIAHQSWGAELATSYDDRSRLFTWREVFILAGMVVVLATPVVVDLLELGDQTARVASMGMLCLVLLPLTAVPILLWVPDSAHRSTMTVDWREALRILLRNSLLWRILIADLATGIATSGTGALYIFLLSYRFELPQLASTALLLIFLISAFAMPFWLKLATMLGKDLCIRIALIVAVLAHVMLYLTAAPGDTYALWAYTIVYGLVFGAPPTLMRSMMADVTDLDDLQTGSKRPGLFFALMTTTGKLGSAVAVGLAFAFVELMYGFAPRQDNDPIAIDGLLTTYCLLAGSGFGFAFFMFVRYPLGRVRHQEIERALAQREAAGS